ncbi:MAG: hypothetical protein U9R57_16665 [Thermodesulfobacteriota bacterium]|nr:hypothetical protein [Thermodesulfobacteriota bacterium]
MYGKIRRIRLSERLLFLLVACLGMSFVCVDGYAASEHQVSDVPRVNISGDNRPLKDIVREVSKQSGYRIEISESLLSIKVSGEFVDVDISTFFRRLMRGSDVFQVIDQESKAILVYTTLRNQQDRILVVDTDRQGNVEDNWLDGEPGRTNKELLQDRLEVFKNYNPADYGLDGEPERTSQDLLDERAAAFEKYDPAVVVLDGESGKTTADLLRDREEAFKKYDPVRNVLDGFPGKTTQDLLDEQTEQFKNYDASKYDLDGQPGRTFQDLLDERDRVFKELNI